MGAFFGLLLRVSVLRLGFLRNGRFRLGCLGLGCLGLGRFRLGRFRLGGFGLGRCGRRRLGRDRHGRGVVARRARARAGDVARRQVPQHGVVDLEDAGDLVEHRGLRVEDDEVVDALLLVRDRIGEPPPSPRVVAVPGSARLLDELARAREDVVLAGLGLLGVQHQQDFVSRHVPRSSLPMVSMSAPTAGTARDRTVR